MMAGNRARAGGTEISPGVVEEVEIALREGKCVIPIGASDHAARCLWDKASSDQERFLPGIKGRSELKVLGKPEGKQ